MFGDTSSGTNDMNWNIPPPSPTPTILPPPPHGAGGDLAFSPYSNKRKPRNVFTLSSTLSEVNVAKLELSRLTNSTTATDSTGDHCRNNNDATDEDEEQPLNSSTDSLSSICTTKLTTRHGSMDNLFKPKNHRSSPSSRNSGGKRSNASDNDREMMERLTEENMMLISDLDKSRRKCLSFKTIGTISFAAFKGQRLRLGEITRIKEAKTMEAAARMILHNLLLNSWRNCKSELKDVQDDNAQLNKTLDNLTLQLRVVRHIQSMEKDKLNEKGAEMERMKAEMARLREENEAKRNSMDKIEGEFNSLQGKVQNLDDLNTLYIEDAILLKETIKALEQSLDSERIKSGMMERTNTAFKQDKIRAEEQLAEFTRQNQHWQERARSFESEVWGLKMDLDTKQAQMKDCRIVCESLRNEKADLMREKSALAQEMKEMSDKLEQVYTEQEMLSKKMEQIKAQKNEEVVQLKASLEMAKKQYVVAEKELLSHQVKNVKRRREWANALYFLVNPLDAFRRSLVPPSQLEKNRRQI